MPDSPLLSILIPTKDRTECARHAIASILAFKDQEFELVVHDNSKDDLLSRWVEKLPKDRRLRYSHTEAPLSMSSNFERTIDLSTGRYLAALGDDDGVNSCVVDVCRWLETNSIEALTPRTTSRYLWPGVKNTGGSTAAKGRLSIGPFSGQLQVIDPARSLYHCVRLGATRLEGLPTLYHGVVKRSVLKKVREQTGHWLPGVSPDMAAAVALASHVKRVALLDYPVFVPGASPNSGAGRGVKKTHHGDLRDEAFLDRAWIDAWPQGVPRFFSGPTMWAAAAIQALQATGRHQLINQFNYAAVHAACLVFVPQRRHEALQSLRDGISTKSVARRTASQAECGMHMGRLWVRRLQSRLVNLAASIKPQRQLELPNIAEAMTAIKTHCAPLLVQDNNVSLGAR